MKKKMKCFTLVELLVVIAILAILGAVGVVGYTSFTKKAHRSNDEAKVVQMNTILESYKQIETIDDVYDVMLLLVLNDVDDFTTELKDTRYTWDSYSNSILYVDLENNILFKNKTNVGDISNWYNLEFNDEFSNIVESIDYASYFN